MIKTTKDKIEEIRANGYQLDFANVFNHAFENYKKIALYAGLMIFVFSVIMGLLISGIIISWFGVATLTEVFKPEKLNALLLSPDHALVILASTVLLSSLLSPFTAGLIKMADCGEKDSSFHVSTMLEYFKAPYFKELFVATFVITLCSSGLSALLDISKIPFPSFIIDMIVWLFTFLTIPLIIFGNLKAIDAIKSSMLIASKQPLTLLGLLVVSYIATLVGFIGCCIGVFFTIPFIYSMYYTIFSEIIGFESEGE